MAHIGHPVQLELETKIERELLSSLYHLYMLFVTIVIRDLGVNVAADF